MNGELKEGDALPSMRLLAKELHISVITTKRAYEELERDGFISTVVGKGSFVAGMNPHVAAEERRKEVERALESAIRMGKSSGMSNEELEERFSLIIEEL